MEKHIHCIICGEYFAFDEEDSYQTYVCKDCMNSFPVDYIQMRIDCDKKGIWLHQFDVLEHRLVWGKDKPYEGVEVEYEYLES